VPRWDEKVAEARILEETPQNLARMRALQKLRIQEQARIEKRKAQSNR
jgi:hypothetical protein